MESSDSPIGQLTEAFRKGQQIQRDAQKLPEEVDGMEIEGGEDGVQASGFPATNSHCAFDSILRC